MKKGIISVLGSLLLIAVLMPSAGFAAASTGAAPQSHKPHLFLAKHQPKHPVSTANVGTPNSSTNPNLIYNGGPVMDGVAKVFAIFWEPSTSTVSASYNSLIERYFGDVGDSPLYQNNQQYTDSNRLFPSGSQLAGTTVDTTSYPSTNLTDGDIQNAVTRAQQANGWTSDIHNIFFVFIAQDEALCIDNTQQACTPNVSAPEQFCAYHNFFSTNTLYAAMPYAASPSFGGSCGSEVFGVSSNAPNHDDADFTINAASHEQMEAATDPLLNAWFDSNGFEIGDKCAFLFGPVNAQAGDVTFHNNPYLLQQEWDNAISGCSLSKNIAPKLYEIVNRNSGLVLDVSGASTNRGAQVIQWSNHHGANQRWTLIPDGIGYQIMNVNSGLVLDVSGASTNLGASVIQWTNHNGINQQWILFPEAGSDIIINLDSGLVNSDRVLDVSGASKNLGAPVIQWSFHNGLNQQWALVPVGQFDQIKNVKSGLALDISGGVTSLGASVIQQTYQNAFSQLWALIPIGSNFQIMNFKSGLVLDVSGASTSLGAQVIQWTNHHGINQQWQLLPSASVCMSGGTCQIRNVNSGLVLDVFGGGTTPGTKVIQWSNHNGTNQQWDTIALSE